MPEFNSLFHEIFVLAFTGLIFRCLVESGMNFMRMKLDGKKSVDKVVITNLFLGVKSWQLQSIMLAIIIATFVSLGPNELNQNPYFLLGLFLPEAGKILGSFMKDSKPQPQ